MLPRANALALCGHFIHCRTLPELHVKFLLSRFCALPPITMQTPLYNNLNLSATRTPYDSSLGTGTRVPTGSPTAADDSPTLSRAAPGTYNYSADPGHPALVQLPVEAWEAKSQCQNQALLGAPRSMMYAW